MSRSSLLSVCLLVMLVATNVTAGPSILIDEVHGEHRAAQFAALWTDCQVEAITADDFILDQVLAAGVVAVPETTITITVPPGSPALYGRFECPEDTFQYPSIRVRDGGGELVAEEYLGDFHHEDPEPGQYTITYDSWDALVVPFEIGVGPHFLTAETVAEYDVVFRSHDNTFMLFGGTLPEYSAREEALLLDRVSQGGGNLLLREPLLEIALKPIIDLTSAAPVTCEVAVTLPGTPTLLEPPCDTERKVDGTHLTWRGVEVVPGRVTRLAYEGTLQPAHHQLQVDTAGGAVALRSRAAEVLRDLVLVRRASPGAWDLVLAGDLEPGAALDAPGARRLDRAGVVDALRSVIDAGGLRGGLGDLQLVEFQDRYRWAERILDGAERDGGWSALYRVGSEVCDRMLPLATTPVAGARHRVLWFWVEDIPSDGLWSGTWPPTRDPAPRGAVAADASPLVVQEYGVVRQRYPRPSGEVQRVLDWFGWSFYDEAGLEDPTDHYPDPTCPYLYVPGGHPDAAALLEGLGWLEGEGTGVVTAPMEERLLVGDDDSHTSDMVFPPGSYPAVVVGRDWGWGRAAALHDYAFLTYWNDDYLRRVLDWLADLPLAAPDPGGAPAAVVSLSASPNPFNPRTEIVFTLTGPGPVTVTVFDAAGRRVATVLHGEVPGGPCRVAWNGRDGDERPVAAGVYLVRVSAPGGERTAKVTLVD